VLILDKKYSLLDGISWVFVSFSHSFSVHLQISYFIVERFSFDKSVLIFRPHNMFSSQSTVEAWLIFGLKNLARFANFLTLWQGRTTLLAARAKKETS
jgi:hypothetical protein